MERSERGVRPVPASAEPSAGGSLSDETLWNTLEAASSPDEVPGCWLVLQCRVVRGCRRGLVLLGEESEGRFSPAASWPEADSRPPALLQLAESALVKRAGALVGAADGGPGAPVPLEPSFVAEPILLAGVLRGAVVLEVTPRPTSELEAVRSQLRLGFGWLASVTSRDRADSESRVKTRLETVLDLVAAALEHERFQGAATAFATELATHLHCDRVSVGLARRGRVRLEALSHSAKFGERTNLVRAIEGAMHEAFDHRCTVVHPAPILELARASHAHAALARQFGSGAVLSVPLVRSGEPCGVLTLEREQPFDAPTVSMVEVVAAFGGAVLDGLRKEDRFIGAKVLDAVRDAADALVGPRHAAWKLAAIVLSAVTLFFAIAHGEFRVTANSVLEPAVKRAAVAPFDGYVAEAPARVGDVVEQGQLLASLDVRDLELERAKWTSQYSQADKQYRQALAERDAAEVEILQAAVDEARAELDRIEDRLARAALRAPFDGVVVTGDLTQRFGAPTKRGEVLFEVAPLDTYRVHLKVSERDIAHVAVGQRGHLALSSLPGETFDLTVDRITPVSEVQDGRNTFRVEAKLDDARLRPGIQGVAKIEVGEKRLLWIWTHDAVDWLRLQLWSWTR